MLAYVGFCLACLMRLDCSLELFAHVEDLLALSGGLQCGEILAFHREAPLTPDKTTYGFPPLVLQRLQEQICCFPAGG